MKKPKFQKSVLTLFMVLFLGLFAACGESENIDNGAKNSVRKSVEKPLVSLETRQNLFNQTFTSIKIQSQDNGTVVEKVVINRGNCVIPYDYVMRSEKQYDEYMTKHLGIKPNEIAAYTLMWLGKKQFKNANGKTLMLDTAISKQEYQNLDEVSKALFDPLFPTKQIPFGDYYSIPQSCPKSKILEVTLSVNGEEVTYKFNSY